MKKYYGYNEDVAQRLYHFICFLNNKLDKLALEDWATFICQFHYEEYINEYANWVRTFFKSVIAKKTENHAKDRKIQYRVKN